MKKQHKIPTGKLSMIKQHWMPIAIVVGFAIVLLLVVRYDVLYKQPPKRRLEDLPIGRLTSLGNPRMILPTSLSLKDT